MDQGQTYVRSLPKSLREAVTAGGPDRHWQGVANPKGQHKGQRKGQGKGKGKVRAPFNAFVERTYHDKGHWKGCGKPRGKHY